jgi:tetraacyldisaccharide 4'-kinase
MKINKPKFWDKKNSIIAILLLPLSLVYVVLIFLKKFFTRARNFKIPIVCIGNIYLGGTGKTPAAILLTKKLQESGKNPVIIRKYYKNHFDEFNLIKKDIKSLIISKSRVNGLLEAEKSDYDLAILDDGFQDYRIKKNLNIICFNNNQLIGNGLTLPSGPLRENLSTLKSADILIINGSNNEKFEKKVLRINKKLEIVYSSYNPSNLDEFKNKKLIAVAGIGNPENFFQLIEKNNLKIEKKLVFPDHYEFKKTEIQNIINEADENNCQVIMTEKDYFKINHFNLDKINYLKVSLDIPEIKKILNKINELYD